MIDSSKSPIPLWRRYATIALLGVVIVVAGYLLWSKELHHSTSAAPAAPTVTAKTSTSKATTPPVAPSTTIPGGIPLSTRNPFGG